MRMKLLDLCLLAYSRARRERDGELLRSLAAELADEHGIAREAWGLLRGGVRARLADRTHFRVSRSYGRAPSAKRVLFNLVLVPPILWTLVALTAAIQSLGGGMIFQEWLMKGLFFGSVAAAYYSPVLLGILVVFEIIGRRARSTTALRRLTILAFSAFSAVLGFAVSYLAEAGQAGVMVACVAAGALYGRFVRLPLPRCEMTSATPTARRP